MAERGYAALLALGGTAHNPPMYYLANGAKVTERTVLVKKQGLAPRLFVESMEREEARRSGLEVMDTASARLREQLRAAGGGRLQGTARWLGGLLREAGVGGGTVAAYGAAHLGAGYGLVAALSELFPPFKF